MLLGAIGSVAEEQVVRYVRIIGTIGRTNPERHPSVIHYGI